jgi:hypothetical protein
MVKEMDPMEAITAPMIVVQRQPILLHTTKNGTKIIILGVYFIFSFCFRRLNIQKKISYFSTIFHPKFVFF